jgi:hypothetical protein
MSAIYENHSVPGSIPQRTVEVRLEHGKVVNIPVLVYERTDRVSVRTGSDANLTGGSYTVQRTGQTWTVIGKGSWIH